MKFTKIFILILSLVAFSCHKKMTIEDLPDYKVMLDFSKKIKPITGLVLSRYAVNYCLPDEYIYKNGVGNFGMSYTLTTTQKNSIALQQARNLLVYLVENFIQEVNSNLEVRPMLDTYPLTSNEVQITLYFQDENAIKLGNGIAEVYFSKGKIKYERYEIYEYTNRYPAIGKDFVIHEESYAEARDIVKNQGTIMDFPIVEIVSRKSLNKSIVEYEEKYLSNEIEQIFKQNFPRVHVTFPIDSTKNTKDLAVERAIQREIKNLSDKAEEILKKNDPKLKQVHVLGDDVGNIMNEAIARLPQKYRETVIIIAIRPLVALNESLGCCKVYNIIGNKDFFLRAPKENGTLSNSIMHIEMIPLTEADSQIRGKCFTKKTYINKVKQIIKEISNEYELI